MFRLIEAIPLFSAREVPAGPQSHAVDLDRLPKWVHRIAINVAKHYRLAGLTNIEDLQSTGYLRVLELVGEFQPSRLQNCDDATDSFCGWAFREVLTTLQREAARIQSGGTIRSPRRSSGSHQVFARPLSDYADESGETFLETPTRRRKSRKPHPKIAMASKHFGKFLRHCQELAGQSFEVELTIEDDGSVCFDWVDSVGRHTCWIQIDGSVSHKIQFQGTS